MFMATKGCVVPRYNRKNISLLDLHKPRNVYLLRRPFLSNNNEYGFFQKPWTMDSRRHLSLECFDGSMLEKVRPIANFEPDVWGDHFLNYSSENEDILAMKEIEHGLLKNELRLELLGTIGKSEEFLKLVDVLERLGVAYHFDGIIEEALRHIYDTNKECTHKENDLNLYHTSLMFRILRQHHYNVTSSVFERFLDERGSFLESLKDDLLSILSLYEAAHVRGKGEDTLEKALEFTRNHLKVIIDSQPNHPLAPQIARSLKYPILRGLIRLESRHYISLYELYPCHSKSLLRFAKLEFDLIQSLYKEELKEITRWKQSFDFTKKFHFVRMRVVELYFFSIEAYNQPQFPKERIIYTKIFVVISIIDDIYDAFGTIDELRVFTKAIERWDKSCVDQLPLHIREYYETLYDIMKKQEDDLATLGRKSYMEYIRRVVTDMCKAYLQEAYWRETKYVPLYDEYFENSLKSSGINLVIAMSLLDHDVEESTARKTLDVIFNDGKPQRAACIIGRLLDDLVDYEFDKQRDHVIGAVDCYMKQYGVSKEEAFLSLEAIVEDAWKDLDEEIFRPTTPIPMPLLMRIHNLCRLCRYLFMYENGYTKTTQRMKDTLTLLFVEPVY